MLLSVEGVTCMKLRPHAPWKFGLVLGMGALVAIVLCVQCVRTYWYTDAVLVPQAAEREAERQVAALTTATRSAGITDPHALGPVIEHTLDSAGDHILWIRILDQDSHLLAHGGKPQGIAQVPSRWWEKMERHENLEVLLDTPEGKAFVTMLPFRMPRPPHPFEAGAGQPDGRRRPPADHRAAAYVVELAIPRQALAGAFEGLRQNLIVGLIASLALLVSVAVIGLRAPHYFRGKYLESELQLARRVQSDLQPKPHSLSSPVKFSALAVAADHVGGDFYDIFETGSGQIAFVLGDVSGKGMSAALLGSVLQGAIRSSTAHQHESACERINRMLCERTAGERFATLFWGVFDPLTATLRYVNAGHAAPMLLRQGQYRIERLDEGGPVLGVLPKAHYSAGTVQIESDDMLLLYSDGIHEAISQSEEEFGEDRILETLSDMAEATPAEVCERIMNRVTAFASAGASPDDRTLLVVRFPSSGAVLLHRQSEEIRVEAVA
jgi:hypothetical protein